MPNSNNWVQTNYRNQNTSTIISPQKIAHDHIYIYIYIGNENRKW